jgi:phosphopentomutase
MTGAAVENRVFLVVIDALGVGALPDAASYGDAPGANTLGNIDRHAKSLHLPTLERLGLGNIIPLGNLAAQTTPLATVGKLTEHSKGKDTTTGHWEMIGIVLDEPFPTYPNGFGQDLIEAFIDQTGCGGVLANCPASGTAVIADYGEQHLATGWPIVYTSADSVWQIAAHVDKVPLDTLYHWCEIARQLLTGPHEVSRVIARPFEGSADSGFKRLGSARHDYAVPPPTDNVLTRLQQAGVATMGVGKIEDIVCGVGLSHSIHTQNNAHGLAVMKGLVERSVDWAEYALPNASPVPTERAGQFVFVNLVETDMNYGHRRDVDGYAQALEAIDKALSEIVPLMGPGDLLMLTGDHGCDPTAPGSDHTREYVPYLAYSPSLPGGSVGTLEGFSVLGHRALEWLEK